MRRKLKSDEIPLVASDEEDRVRQYYSWPCILLYTSTVLIVSALITLFGVRAWFPESHEPKSTFQLLATRSSASLTQWLPRKGDDSYLSKIEITFSEDIGNPQVCDDADLCITWTGDEEGVLLVNKIETPEDIVCHEHSITAAETIDLTACILLQGDQLYGGAIKGTQYWPSQNNTAYDSVYVTGMEGNEGVVERYWIMSSGKAVFVPSEVPLFVSQNTSVLCLQSKIEEPYFPDETQKVNLKYYLCTSNDLKAMHLYATQRFLGLPRDIPDERMIRHPVWSTWARYKKLIDEDIVIGFADQILLYGFNNSQLEIDDNWETCYGSAVFYNKTFPDPKSLVTTLKSKGFRVTLWTHPFINLFCPAHNTAFKNDYLAKSETGSTLTYWWDGEGGMINFTNPEATSWWSERLYNISSNYGFDAFKFDAGEAGYLPESPDVGKLDAPIRLQPNAFTTDYVKTVASISTLNLAEVRVVFRNQEEPIFVRMSDKSSSWSIENGLKALVTTLLAMNIVGYSYVLPDMIGGNQVADKELFIRWLQANTFMPSIQFSLVPWDYDDETVLIAKKFTSLHYQYSDKIIELAKKKQQDGTPINLPIWWIDPTDTEAQIIDSEYLLGEDILVAPVMEKGALSRDIYLPKGLWRDELHPGNLISGRQWLRNFTVQLDELAYFTRM